MRKGWRASSQYVVFQDILIPLAWSVTKERAFALIMEQIGYEPLWTETAERVTLAFRLVNSQEQAPEVFARDNNFGIHATRESLMGIVFAARLQGCRALTSSDFTVEHSVAKRTIYTVWDWPERRRRLG